MASELSSDSESFLQQQVALGAYRDRTDAIEAAVDLLRSHKALLARLDESRRQLDEGEYVEFDDEGLRQFFEGLKQRAQRCAEAE